MKAISDKLATAELIARINLLDGNSKPLWGKMTVGQMLKHLAMWEEMAMNVTPYKQSFIGRLFGKMALKDMMKDEPVKRNLPTMPNFKITDNRDIATEKLNLINLLQTHVQQGDQGFLHPFFGNLTPEQAGQMAYKHADHHLRQFGV